MRGFLRFFRRLDAPLEALVVRHAAGRPVWGLVVLGFAALLLVGVAGAGLVEEP